MSKKKKNRKIPNLNGKEHEKALVLSGQITAQTPTIIAEYNQVHKDDNYPSNGIGSVTHHLPAVEASAASEVIHLEKGNSASGQNGKKRRPPKEQKHTISLMQRFNADYYVKAIIKQFDHIHVITGDRPSTIFENFIDLTEATLRALPEQVKALGNTGQFKEDDPETQEIFSRIQSRYRRTYRQDGERTVWACFVEAFGLLLNSAQYISPWTENTFYSPMGGPDILGHVYEIYASYDPSWLSQYFSPYSVCLLCSKIVVPSGEKDVIDRLRQACRHPDNPYHSDGPFGMFLGRLGMVPGEGEEDISWPMVCNHLSHNRFVQAALEFYEPITVNEPCVGSGRMLLALAGQYPREAVHLNLVQFSGQDIDKTVVTVSRINFMLHGIGGYGLRLYVAASEAFQAYQERQKKIVEQALEQNRAMPQLLTPGLSKDSRQTGTFEQFYRRAAGSLAAATTSKFT
jgi:hypothetical protein